VGTPTPTPTPAPTPTETPDKNPDTETPKNPTTNAEPLATLGPNTARVIGSYANPDPQFNTDGLGAADITDYSGMAYDPVGKRICMFGGGHGPSQETDIRVLDLTTLAWSSLYAPTGAKEMKLANLDADRGRYISTNQPTARHTYNLTLVRGRRFYMLAPRGMPGLNDIYPSEPQAHPGGGWGGRICWYDFDTGTWTYGKYGSAYTSPPNAPWYFASAAVLDPVSDCLLVIGPNTQAGAGALWLYDPTNDTVTTGPECTVGSCDFVYFPPNDRFYALQSDGGVFEVQIDRQKFAASTVTSLTVTGTRPASDPGIVCGYAYDSISEVIGGNVAKGVFYAFDPLTRTWTSKVMRLENPKAGLPNLTFHCLEFDPVSGCFIFLENPQTTGGARTWAYRYAGFPQPPNNASTSAVTDLSVQLDLGNGSVARFSGASAVDVGDFAGEFVHQKCYLAQDPAYPDWRVYFRVDADASGQRIVAPATGWRDEVIVEYGRSKSGKPTHWITPYTATITKNGATVYTATVAKHYWYARWRYQSSERPIVRTPAMLKARGWIPNFGAQGMFRGGAHIVDNPWPGPMQNPSRAWPSAPCDPRMANGGDHDEIGYLTEAAASYVIFGAPNNLRTLRTEGEWTGSWPIFIRDEMTGAPIGSRDLTTGFRAQGGTVNDIVSSVDTDYVHTDTSHYYACANLPWLLTDDPFFLEALQFGMNWRTVFSLGIRQRQGLGGICTYPGETRSYAWGLRDLFLLAASSPASVPQWLQPKSYWQGLLDDNKTFAMRFVNSPARTHKLFKAWTRLNFEETWMSAWLSTVVGLGVEQGARDWLPVFNWSIDKQIQMTNGTSGWPRQWPIPYISTPWTDTPAVIGGFDYEPYLDTTPDSHTHASWAAYWAYYKAGSQGYSDDGGGGNTISLDDSKWDGHTLMAQYLSFTTPHVYETYHLHLRSALSQAVRQGAVGAQGCYDFLQREMTSAFTNWGGNGPRAGQCRFSIDP
jgi:hypothetical protein